MDLGNFCVCLSVADLQRSLDFYSKLGFDVVSGDADQGWLVLRNGPARIGIFQGMFDGMLLTFNPGWDPDAQPLGDFDDVREIQAQLQRAGIALTATADPDTSGPAFVTLTDPDGYNILIDQHR
ncbi:MAG: VOC family protein [Actinobacteria bacterium]|nr:MAG: VOC family protein [Actinomycetota bacterium]